MSDMNLFFLILSESVCLATGLLLLLIPVITRKELLFGVRIPETAHDDPDVRRMKLTYGAVLAAATVFALAGGIWIYVLEPGSALLLCLYQPLALMILQALTYLPLWKRALHLKAERGWKTTFVGTSQTTAAISRGRLRGLPWGWYSVSCLLCILAAAYAIAVYPSLPDILITHWNAAMEADAWKEKSLATVLTIPAVSLGMTALMLGCNIVVYFTKLQISAENPVLSYTQHRAYRRLKIHVFGFITLMIALMFLLTMPMVLNLYIPSASLMMGGILFFTVLILIPAIWLPIKAGQGGSRLKPVLDEREKLDVEKYASFRLASPIDRSDDSLWKLGIFYFNRDDPSLFVEDRFGSNGGLNYARIPAKIIAVCIAVFTIATYVFSTILFISLMRA